MKIHKCTTNGVSFDGVRDTIETDDITTLAMNRKHQINLLQLRQQLSNHIKEIFSYARFHKLHGRTFAQISTEDT